jgi:hypothetical protein
MEAGSREATLWNSYFKPSANAIPQVYIVRADGQELYNQIGGLSASRLQEVMTIALEQAGSRIDKSEARLLKRLAGQLKIANRSKNLANGLMLLDKEKELIPKWNHSYAEEALEFRKEFNRLEKVLATQVEQWNRELADFQQQDLKTQVQTFELIENLVPFLDDSAIWNLDLSAVLAVQETAAFRKIRRDHEVLQQMENASGETLPTTLADLQQQYQKTGWEKRLEKVARRVAIISDPSNNESRVAWKTVDGQVSRQWTSNDGNFSVSAKLIRISSEAVQLVRDDGPTITVPLNRLSDLDRRWLESLR